MKNQKEKMNTSIDATLERLCLLPKLYFMSLYCAFLFKSSLTTCLAINLVFGIVVIKFSINNTIQLINAEMFPTTHLVK